MADEKEELRKREYIGPVHQEETPINATVVAHGRDTGCASCRNSDTVSELTAYVKTAYVVMGVQHEHVYKSSMVYNKG